MRSMRFFDPMVRPRALSRFDLATLYEHHCQPYERILG
jgi:hypothetical protein